MTLTQNQLGAQTDILREVLSQVSSDELPLLESFVKSGSNKDSFDGMLGFGGGPELLLVLPIVSEMLRQLASTAAGDAAKEWGHELSAWVTKPKADIAKKNTLVVEFEDELQRRLKQRGFSQQKAAEVADCVVATLAGRADLLQRLPTKK